ncbi:MAG: RNA polymerase sigma factor [Alistipes sp.]|nr:RNA polymerase sigma factor [Alistipes sp.]
MSTTTDRYIELITEVKDTVYRLALNLLADRSEAEDVAQDVYERVWRTRDEVLSRSYPRAYICRMTRNLAIDRLRQRRDTAISETRGMSSGDGNSIIEINDMAALTQQYIAELPERQRITIYMRDVEGYSFEEIAETMESDPTTVRMNLSRARKTIRDRVLKAMNYGTRQD